jgi:N-acetylmuramidase
VTLRELLPAKDWEKFARAYNGPSYRANKYDIKLQAAYENTKAQIG